MDRFTVLAQHVLHGLLWLGWTLLPAQAQVHLAGTPVELASFETCLLTASRATGEPNRWEWSVLSPGGGGFTRRGRSGPRNLYRAPRVDAPRTIRVGVRERDPNPEAPWTELEIRVRPARIRIGSVQLPSRRVNLDPVTLVAGRTCALQALADPEQRPGAWTWSIREPQGGRFTRHRTGPRNVYRAPWVLAPRTFQISVSAPDSGASGLFPITVVPAPQRHPHAHLLTGKCMDASLGDDWDLPGMTWVGSSGLPGLQQAGPNWRAGAMCYVEGPIAGSEEGFWLVADRTGISRVERSGAVSRLELRGRFAWDGPEEQDGSDFVCEALAARPPGSGAGVPAVVAVFRSPMPTPPTRESDQYGCQYLCTLGADGGVRPLAGRSLFRAMEACDAPVYTGPAAEVDFRQVSGLALDTQGTVHLVDRTTWARSSLGIRRCASGGLRRLLPDGRVECVVAPAVSYPDLHEASAQNRGILREPLGLALDPATGVLYTCERNAIKAILPSGATQPILGNSYVEGFGPPPEAPAPPGVASLFGPSALCFQGGLLYISDHHNCALRAYDPVSRRVRTVAGQPGQHYPRPGPLGLFAPHLLPEECAALGHPGHLAVHGGGPTALAALVALDAGVARLDLGPGPFGPMEEGAALEP